MTGGLSKIEFTYAHTEVVYYDANGQTIHRDVREDTWCQDRGPRIPITARQLLEETGVEYAGE